MSERLAAVAFAQTRKQQQLAERSEEVSGRTGAVLAPIEDIAPTRESVGD